MLGPTLACTPACVCMCVHMCAHVCACEVGGCTNGSLYNVVQDDIR